MTPAVIMAIAGIITALGAYLCGSVPFGLLIGLSKGIDIRKAGSGNIGATNVTRVVGKGWGKLCFALDFLKGCTPVVLAQFAVDECDVPDTIGLLPALAALFTVCGHVWPVWLKFKGGKGVSTAGGALLALNPLSIVVGLLIWGTVFLISRYVSLASITVGIAVPALAFLFSYLKMPEASVPELILFCIIGVLIIVKHSSNIKRLCNGTENRFEKKKPEAKS